MTTRTVAVAAAAVGAAVLATTGITYASAAGSVQAAPFVRQAAPAAVVFGDEGGGNDRGNEGRGNGGDNGGDYGRGNGRGNGGDYGRGNGGDNGGGYGGGNGRGDGGGYGGGFGRGDGRDGGYDDDYGDREGRIQFNERTYSAHTDGCITVVSGLGSRSFNVRNDSRKTVEVFSGVTCDDGSPVATVGPWSTSNGVFTRFVRGGVWVKHGVVGSFRVVDNYRDRW
ncbi:hypothetical protein OHA79_43325 [Streptomyces sp. NBC_00841]|uniref:hypothetical protein n=1 Tax=Streptomyces sp. NBC_00841 TaxID=2975847 RepID=UPI002DDB6504|nr:hypothetical protein [Streptomyces sp. NBC_00841]WSA04022.1 hypothetical protein OHA79_43325 [Streptomyces sp. NBC_00841]